MRQKRIVGLFSPPKCERCSKVVCRILALTVARWLDIWHMAPFRNRLRFMREYFRCLAVAGRNGMIVGMLRREEDIGNSPCPMSRSVRVVLQMLSKRVVESCRNPCIGIYS